MTEEASINQQEVVDVYPDFVDWITPTDISLDRDGLKLRWQTIHRVFIDEDRDDIDNIWVDELIVSALGFMQSRPEALDNLREKMRADDIMFPGNRGSRDEELKVLSSYCLRLLIDNDLCNDDYCSRTTTKILSASLNGTKSYKGGIDLIELAKSNSFEYARKLRERTNLVSPLFSFRFSTNTNSALENLDENISADMSYNKTAILAVVNELERQLNAATSRMKTHVENINTENRRVAEEQEILWFVNLGWSDKFDTNYSNLSEDVRIFDFANALCSRTHLNVELPSVKALAGKIGIESQNIHFRKWVEAVANDYPEAIDEYEGDVSELTPCFYAIKLAIQGSWYKKWKEHIGLDSNFELDSLELTQQIYREFLVLGWS